MNVGVIYLLFVYYFTILQNNGTDLHTVALLNDPKLPVNAYSSQE